MRVEEPTLGVQHREGRHAVGLQQFRGLPRRPLLCPLRQPGVQLRPVAQSGVAAGEHGGAGPIGAAHGLYQPAPLVFGAHGDGHPLVFALAGIVAVGRHHRVVVALGLWNSAGEFVFHQARAHGGHRGPQHRNVDVLSAPGAIALAQSRDNGKDGVERAAEVGVGVLETQRAAAFALGRLVAHGAVQPRQRADGGGVGPQVAQRPGLAVGGYRSHHQPGVVAAQRVVVQSQALHHAWGEVLDDDVALRRQPPGQRHRLGPRGVEGDAALSPVDVVEHGVLFRVRLVADDRPAQAHIVHALTGFDLDDLGPHVGQDHPRHRPGQHPAEIQYAVALKGAGRRVRRLRHI